MSAVDFPNLYMLACFLGRTITQQVHQPKDIRSHSYRPITFTKQVSRRTDGRTHTDSSPLGNESA
jgi:hypothetical protein